MGSKICPIVSRSEWGQNAGHHLGVLWYRSSGQNPVANGVLPTAGWLVFVNGVHAGEDQRLALGQSEIGGSWECQIVITSPGVGSRHARIEAALDSVTLVLTDQNRTILHNGVSVQSAQLEDNDVVCIGDVWAVYRSSRRMGKGYRPKPNGQYIPPHVMRPIKNYVVGWLVAVSSEISGYDFRLLNDSNTIGKKENNRVALEEQGWSPIICTLMAAEGQCRLDRVDQTSVIEVNGAHIGAGCVLEDSDLLKLEQKEFYLKWF